MSPAILGQLWVVIEETQTSALLDLSDAGLIQRLLCQLMLRQLLPLEALNTVTQYLHSGTR